MAATPRNSGKYQHSPVDYKAANHLTQFIRDAGGLGLAD